MVNYITLKTRFYMTKNRHLLRVLLLLETESVSGFRKNYNSVSSFINGNGEIKVQKRDLFYHICK